MPSKSLTIREDKNTVKFYDLTVAERASKRIYWAQIKLDIETINRIKNNLIIFK